MTTDAAATALWRRRTTGGIVGVVALALAVVVVGIVYDVRAYAAGGTDATISGVMRDFGQWPALVFLLGLGIGLAVGFCAGHWWMSLSPKAVPDARPVSVAVAAAPPAPAPAPDPAIVPEFRAVAMSPGEWVVLDYTPGPDCPRPIRTYQGPDAHALARDFAARCNAGPPPTRGAARDVWEARPVEGERDIWTVFNPWRVVPDLPHFCGPTAEARARVEATWRNSRTESRPLPTPDPGA